MSDKLAVETDLLPQYAVLLPTIRRVAHEHGYAIGLHGSGQRDLDLIAAPWVDDAKPAATLVESIRLAIGGAIVSDDNAPVGDWTRSFPEPKPHGRLAWSIQVGGGRYVDLSVMPVGGALAAEAASMLTLLVHLSQWDMLDSLADGPYWEREIKQALGTTPVSQLAAELLTACVAESNADHDYTKDVWAARRAMRKARVKAAEAYAAALVAA